MASTFAHSIDPLLASASRTATVGLADTYAPRPPRPSAAVFRRRRRTVGAVAAFAAFTVFFATNALATDPSADIPPAPRTIVAQPGDTIWEIAREISPSGDITELVEALILTNGSQIEAGQIVRIP